MDDALLSRSGRSSGQGKCTEEVKTLVPAELKEELTGLAFVAGVPLSEYVREVLTTHARGAVYALRVRALQGAATAGKGKESSSTQED